MKKKRILALLLAASMSLSLAACGGGDKPSDTPAGGTETPGGSTAAQTEITWWAFPTFGVDSGYEQEVANAFMAANPDVKVNIETIDFTAGPDKLTAAISAGTAPDVLFDAPGRIIEYGNAGYLVSLDDMMEALKGDLANENLVETCVGADGTAYMYPISSSPFYMGLNKEALEKADALQYVNLEGDRAWTTENFVKMCEALSAAGATTVPGIVYCGGQGGDQGTRALVNNLFSSSIVGEDGKWNIDANGVKALEQLKAMYDSGALDAGFDMAAADELQKFQQETAAMTFCWGTSNAKSYASEDFTQISVPFPSDDGKPELEYLVNGFCVFNNKDDAKIDAAKRLVAFICDDAEWGPKSVKQSGAFPVRTSFGNLYEGDKEMSLLASWIGYYGPYYNTRAGFATMRTEWWNMLQRVFQEGDVQAQVDIFNTNANA
ncbi:ABC transporter substrate-binding protein [Flavonifractor sp. AGMB03687]|uniref:ABC transporter substrate-binding protein n=1 Tax=Flavonifractor sp. AGMB03687 TaxID=2785133 RepID=UPI001ADF4B99|nr:ABC transporter substrate-binding protein [Flavonifractor sp. AGMB03687]